MRSIMSEVAARSEFSFASVTSHAFTSISTTAGASSRKSLLKDRLVQRSRFDQPDLLLEQAMRGVKLIDSSS